MGSRVPPAETTTRLPASGPVWPRSSWQRAKSSSGSTMRPGPCSPSASSPSAGPSSSTPRSASAAAFAWVAGCSHMRTFMAGAARTGPRKASPSCGEDVVGEPVRQLGERVRRERRDDEQVRVDEVRVEVPRRLAAGERLEGVRGHEPLGIRCQDRSHIVAGPYEESAKLARLVGGDPTRDSEKNSSHPGSQRLLSSAARL